MKAASKGDIANNNQNEAELVPVIKENIERYNHDIDILVIGKTPVTVQQKPPGKSSKRSPKKSPKKSPKEQKNLESWANSTFGPPQTRSTVVHQTNWSLRFF